MERLTKHISCKCKCKFDGRKCNSNQKRNNNKFRCKCKKHICEKDYIWNPATCSCKNGKYLAIIKGHSVITCDEIIDTDAMWYDKETKPIPKSFNEEKGARKTQNFYILLAILLITMALLLAASITVIWTNIEQNKNTSYRFTSQITN